MLRNIAAAAVCAVLSLPLFAEDKGQGVPGWIKKSDVVSFSYECGCAPRF